jgi:hypothetical protein
MTTNSPALLLILLTMLALQAQEISEQKAELTALEAERDALLEALGDLIEIEDGPVAGLHRWPKAKEVARALLKEPRND